MPASFPLASVIGLDGIKIFAPVFASVIVWVADNKFPGLQGFTLVLRLRDTLNGSFGDAVGYDDGVGATTLLAVDVNKIDFAVVEFF